MMTVQDLIEDCEWILNSTTDPVIIANRLGYTSPKSLARRLSRAGRHDLANMLSRKSVAA